jgi:hypothetical protein
MQYPASPGRRASINGCIWVSYWVMIRANTVQAAEKLGFVSGHDFSRAVMIGNTSGFSP